MAAFQGTGHIEFYQALGPFPENILGPSPDGDPKVTGTCSGLRKFSGMSSNT